MLPLYARRVVRASGIQAFALAAAIPLAAQSSLLPFPASGYVVERDTHERWLNAEQSPAFTPFFDTRLSLRIGLVSATQSERTLWVAPIGDPAGALRRWTLDSTGRIIQQTPPPPSDVRALGDAKTRADSDRVVRMRGIGVRLQRLTLPETNGWDLFPIFRPDRPRVGARWVDTVTLAASAYQCEQSLDEVRSSEIVADTAIDGRTAWVVRTTGRVEYRDHYLVDEPFIDTTFAVERSASGVATGVYVFDQERGLFLSRTDSTRLTGTATLRMPGRPVLTTPTSYESVRRSSVTAAGSGGADVMAGPGGLAFLPPPNPYQRRLATGDTILRDSLLMAWNASRDPVDRATLSNALLSVPSSLRIRERMASLAQASNDLTWLWAGDATGRATHDTDRVQRTLSLLRDPARAWASGVDVGLIYWSIAWAIYDRAPVALSRADVSAGMEPGCWPGICPLLTAQWHGSTDPWLRDLGLVTLVATAGRPWGDTLAARVKSGDRFLKLFQVPFIPQPTADWTAWIWALNGCAGSGCAPWTFERWDGGLRNREQIQFAEAWTGRDVVAELRRKAALETNDSARVVYEDVLLGFGADGPSSDVVARRIGSSIGTERWAGRQEAHALLMVREVPADSIAGSALVDRLLSVLIDGAPAWTDAGQFPMPDSALHRVSIGQAIKIVTPSLLPAARARWATRATVAPASTSASPLDSLPHVEIRIAQPWQAGPFARVVAHVVGVEPMAGGRTRTHAMTDVEVELIDTADGWRVLTVNGRS
ncbi:MAG TPA: hypothetical protein VMH39_06240 [Gemmatimonadaceae bacterium]|nr:hypothetical protein [Gemmatimonadaceae bacterium]